MVFSLGAWSPRIPTRYLPHGTWDTARGNLNFADPAITVYGTPFQVFWLSKLLPYRSPATPNPCELGLDCCAFALRLLTQSLQFLFLSLLRCFSSGGSPSPPPYGFGRLSIRWDFSIRTPPDHSFLTAPRRLSWSRTSFFGQKFQGIHCLLLLDIKCGSTFLLFTCQSARLRTDLGLPEGKPGPSLKWTRADSNRLPSHCK